MNKRAGETELLFHSARQLTGPPFAKRPQSRHSEQLREAIFARAPPDPMQVGKQLEVFFDGQVLVQSEPLWHVADLMLNGRRLFRQRMAENANFPCNRR